MITIRDHGWAELSFPLHLRGGPADDRQRLRRSKPAVANRRHLSHHAAAETFAARIQQNFDSKYHRLGSDPRPCHRGVGGGWGFLDPA